MHGQGLQAREIAQAIGRHHESVRRVVDPAYVEMRTLQIARAKLGSVGEPKVDLHALWETIPADTRSLTGRICGDPLPGRSALHRRAGA